MTVNTDIIYKTVFVDSDSNPTVLTAPSVDGYEFLCWNIICLQGAVYHFQLEDSLSSIGKIYHQETGGTFIGNALYCKKEYRYKRLP